MASRVSLPSNPRCLTDPFNTPGLSVSSRADAIHRTTNAGWSAVQDMRIYHGGIDFLVSQEFLYCPDVVFVLDQMGCKGIAERVAPGSFCHTARGDCFSDGSLHEGLIDMTPDTDYRFRISHVASDHVTIIERYDDLSGPPGKNRDIVHEDYRNMTFSGAQGFPALSGRLVRACRQLVEGMAC